MILIKHNFALFFTVVLISLVFHSEMGCSSDDNSDGSDADGDTDSDGDSDSDTDSEEGQDTDFSDENFDINVKFSNVISTVAIVKWSTTLNPFDSAQIEFGLTEDYGMTAPVDLAEPDFRTLLLGMKPSRDYHFRITVFDGDTPYSSDDFVITTGPLPNGLPTSNVTTIDPDAMQGGYIVTIFFMTCDVFIADSDGDYVWWFFPPMAMCSRARMSYDGKQMIMRNVNVGGGGPGGGASNNGMIYRVNMDGSEGEIVHTGYGHHDFTVLPDHSIAFIAYDGENCDDIREIGPDGTIEDVFHIADAITPPLIKDGCHSNSINYWPEDDSYTVSVLNSHLFIKFTRSGDLVWILGSENENDFAGDLNWFKQHGHHLYDDKILFFNNGSAGADSSRALIYSIDETNLQAELIWNYASGNASNTMGDAQHLSGGNIVVTFSNDGVIHEVDPDGNLVQEMAWSQGGGLGYAMKRDSLYGPPPK